MDSESNNNVEENIHTNVFKKTNNLLGIDFMNHFSEKFEEKVKYAKEYFEIFSTVSVALLAIVFWLLRAIGYCYQSGIISVYNISKYYIEIDDNFLFQLTQALAFIIIFFLLNYTYVCLSFQKKTWKLKLINIKKTLFVLFEMACICIYILESGSVNLKENCILISFLVSCFFNIYGIQVVFLKVMEDMWKGITELKNPSNSHIQTGKTTQKETPKSAYFIMLIIIVPILLCSSYLFGKSDEQNRHAFKIVEVQVDNSKDSSDNYIFSDNSDGEDKFVYFYPVIYENRDVFILARLYKDGNEIKIDTNYQKIIEKNNIETYTINDIYKIKITE